VSTGDDARRAAEAAAERVMAQYRLQQEIESAHVRHGRAVGRGAAIAGIALAGAFAGGMTGALRGHVVAGAVLLGLVAGLLAAVQTRPR